MEEFRKDMLEGACNVVKEVRTSGVEEDDFPEVKRGGLERLIRVYGFIMAAVYKWRKKEGAVGPVIINPIKKGEHVIGYPSAECLRSAELYLLEQAQKGMKISGAKMLPMDVVTEEDINGVKRKLIVIEGQISDQGRVWASRTASDGQGSQIKQALRTGCTRRRAQRHTFYSAQVETESVGNQWTHMAESVRFHCTECRLKEKRCMEQSMGPLPDHRVELGAIFQSVAVDLFGPIEYQRTVNKRQVGKGWGVMFACTTTSAIHVEFVDTYSTDSFLMALRRFMCLRGVPSQFQSDRGEQLVAASKQIAMWNFNDVMQWAGRKGVEWVLVPTGGQHFNEQAERMIGLIKKQI